MYHTRSNWVMAEEGLKILETAILRLLEAHLPQERGDYHLAWTAVQQSKGSHKNYLTHGASGCSL